MLSPFVILDIEDNADDATVRAAYTRALRRCPPDRDPEGFGRIREAYEMIRDAEKRARLSCARPSSAGPGRGHMRPDTQTKRRHVGPAAWLNILREPQR